MASAKLRLLALAVTAVLFFAWIGWLGFEVAHRPTVLARDAFLVADVTVIAHIAHAEDLGRPVKVEKVAWAKDAAGKDLVGQEIRVTNLSKCRADWRGPEDYILPLLAAGDGTYEVADPTGLTDAEKRKRTEPGGGPPTRSPGYVPEVDPQTRTLRPPHIYPLTEDTRAQLHEIHP
jgi:hypothetical protein